MAKNSRTSRTYQTIKGKEEGTVSMTDHKLVKSMPECHLDDYDRIGPADPSIHGEPTSS